MDYITIEDKQKYEAEYRALTDLLNGEIAQKIKEARAQGDLSENAEYDAAKDQQAKTQERIWELKKILENAEVIDTSRLNTVQIQMGNTVRLYDCDYDEEVSYKIVGSTNADPMNGTISNVSPLGVALDGKQVGDEVDVPIPNGVARYKVLEIIAD